MIRRALPDDADLDWIRETSGHAYSQLGDYRRIIPAWMVHPGVLTFLDTSDTGTRRGFILLGFYEPPDLRAGELAADLVAIAVAPEFQRLGVGRGLLSYAIEFSTLARDKFDCREMRLTVAHTNTVALAMFTKFGFEVLDDNHGFYDGGQRAIRMKRSLTS